MMVQAPLIRDIVPGLSVIQISMFPVYLLKGERSILIDSGVTTGVAALRAALEKLLPNGGPDLLLLTHSHWDHAGGAFELQSRLGFAIRASARAVELLARPRVRAFIHHLNREHALQAGAEPPPPYAPLTDMTALQEGDRVEVDARRRIEVYAVPGHTRCSLAYFLQPEGILFPGDAVGVLERDGSIKPLFLSSYREYEASLQKLLGLDARILCFAHNRVLDGRERVRAFLEASLARTREVHDRVRERLAAGMAREAIAEELYAAEFPQPTVMGPREALIINLRAMVHAIEKEAEGA